MEKFDNAVNTAKDALSKASEYAGKAVKAGKTKTDIISRELKLKRDYEKLGRLTYDGFCGNEDTEAVSVMCRHIAKKEAELAELKNEADNK